MSNENSLDSERERIEEDLKHAELEAAENLMKFEAAQSHYTKLEQDLKLLQAGRDPAPSLLLPVPCP